MLDFGAGFAAGCGLAAAVGVALVAGFVPGAGRGVAAVGPAGDGAISSAASDAGSTFAVGCVLSPLTQLQLLSSYDTKVLLVNECAGYAAAAGPSPVVVATDRGDAALDQQLDRFDREDATIDDVSAAHDRVATEALDLEQRVTQRVHVGVKVGDDREAHGVPDSGGSNSAVRSQTTRPTLCSASSKRCHHGFSARTRHDAHC